MVLTTLTNEVLGRWEMQQWFKIMISKFTLQWRHNGHDGVSNHQPHHGLLNRLFRHRTKKTSKPRVTGLCEGNSPVTGELPAQRASNAEMFPLDYVIMNVQNSGLRCHCTIVLRWGPYKSTLVQVKAWWPSGKKPISKPMLTKICVAVWRL